jgi:NodT family efflux transporter outer membrane factor (OMF) lipoprotein
MRLPRSAVRLALCVLLTGCMVGPDYKKPDAPPSPVFKEAAGWKPAAPRDGIDKGAWWSIYNDPELDRLERMVNVSNQTIKENEAEYRNAVALVGEARAALFPTASVTSSVTHNGSGAGGGAFAGAGSSGGGRAGTIYSIEGTAGWDIDVWGKVRRQIESNVAGAQVSAADLANAQLSAQATLATDYFDLRAEDSLEQLLRDTVAAYQKALDITRNQYRAGTAASTDYLTAVAQLQSTQALLAGVGVQRQMFEHAIAMLTGHAPADITIKPKLLTNVVPVVPAGLPSALLERRPDVAAAERQMQQENALIGVQIAAYYPDISLSAIAGFEGAPLAQLFNLGNRFWSLGASAVETIYSGGARPAAVKAAEATYDQFVATYRQTVLTAFQQVEDALSSLRILQDQAAAEDVAIASTQKAVDAILNQYRAGTVAYTSVITEQALLLGDQQTGLSIRQSRLVESVALIQALGGGWTTEELPKRGPIIDANPAFP